MNNNDTFKLGKYEFTSRFILGSGKYSLELIDAAVKQAEAQQSYPLPRQRPADKARKQKASKCRPTKANSPSLSQRPHVRQRKQSFQMSSDKANSPSSVKKEAKLQMSSVLQKIHPKKEGPAMITIKFNGKPTQIPTSTPITTFLTTHNYNPIHVVVELNEVIIPKDSYPTTTLSPDDTLEILTFMGGGQ